MMPRYLHNMTTLLFPLLSCLLLHWELIFWFSSHIETERLLTKKLFPHEKEILQLAQQRADP